MHCDSQSAIHLSKNSSFHSKSKHIDVRYHWIRDVLEEKKMHIEKIHTNENGSDMMTKSLSREKLEVCKQKATWLCPPLEMEGESCWGLSTQVEPKTWNRLNSE